MANQLYQYETPPMPQKWTQEERLFYTRLIDVLDDIYQRFGNTDNALEDYKKALAETVEAIESKTTENSQAIEDIIGGDTPVVTKTVTFTCSASGTYRTKSGSGWLANDIIQGYNNDHYVNYGCMWFGSMSVLSGKTLTEAKLRVKRQSAYGASISTKTLLGACNNTGRTGTIAVGDLTTYGQIGTATKDKFVDMTVPLAAVTALVSGSKHGLVFYSETSASYYSSYMFSKNYAGFYGANQNSNAPKLIVTYEE